MPDKPRDTESAVLAMVKAAPQGVSPVDVREQLTKQGHAEGAVRTAVAKLWDAGQLNVGTDRKLRPADHAD